MASVVETLRERARGVRVLVVHDESPEMTLLCDLLKKELVVRQASTVAEAARQLSQLSFECVVCALGGELRAQEFLAAVAGAASPADAKYVLFVVPTAMASESVLYARKDDHAGWAREANPPEALGAITRALESVREPLSTEHRVVPR